MVGPPKHHYKGKISIEDGRNMKALKVSNINNITNYKWQKNVLY
jgi:hypothetical protein